MTNILTVIHGMIWGAPALILILGVGIYLTIRTGFCQITLFPRAMNAFFATLFQKDAKGEGSSFRSLCTALGATVGTGNLVGVAGAICLGGPGAVFWMWICGVLGMATKYAEVTLAVRYRQKQGNAFIGGPMYMISRGLGTKWKWLAGCYCAFGVIASFGVGNATQINAVITGVNGFLASVGFTESPIRNLAIGVALSGIVGAMLFGGAKRIGAAAEKLVPIMSGAYILLCLGVLIFRWNRIDDAFSQIFQGAFSPKAVTGGMLGSAFQALKVGCSRGVFTNEAGMGTASIAHASAGVSHPAEQGLMGIVEVFLDTIVICTLTALVILLSGVPIPYGCDVGGELTNAAFYTIYGSFSSAFLSMALCCFALATVLGWGLYGGRCAQYLFGSKAWNGFAFAQTAVVFLGSVMNTESVWLLAETVNGLMAIPNLLTLAALTPELVRLTIEYKEKTGLISSGGGTYANFHQRKPLRTLSYAEIPSPGGGSEKRR